MGTGHTRVTYPVRVHCQGAPLSVILLLKHLLTHIWDDFDTPQQACNTTRSTTINMIHVQISLYVALESSLHHANVVTPTPWYVDSVRSTYRTNRRITIPIQTYILIKGNKSNVILRNGRLSSKIDQFTPLRILH